MSFKFLFFEEVLIKEQPRTQVTHFRKKNFKHKMNTDEKTANPAKTCARSCRLEKKNYIHEIAAAN